MKPANFQTTNAQSPSNHRHKFMHHFQPHKFMPLKTKCYVSNHISLCSVRPDKLMHFQTTAVILFMKFQQISSQKQV